MSDRPVRYSQSTLDLIIYPPTNKDTWKHAVFQKIVKTECAQGLCTVIWTHIFVRPTLLPCKLPPRSHWTRPLITDSDTDSDTVNIIIIIKLQYLFLYGVLAVRGTIQISRNTLTHVNFFTVISDTDSDTFRQIVWKLFEYKFFKILFSALRFYF